MMSKFDWRTHGTEGIGNNPPIPIWECMIGKDKNGDTWLCRVRYRHQERRFIVMFDKDVVTDNDSPFLRDEVVYADNYWQAMRDYHKAILCDYEKIQDVIAEFINKNGVE